MLINDIKIRISWPFFKCLTNVTINTKKCIKSVTKRLLISKRSFYYFNQIVVIIKVNLFKYIK